MSEATTNDTPIEPTQTAIEDSGADRPEPVDEPTAGAQPPGRAAAGPGLHARAADASASRRRAPRGNRIRRFAVLVLLAAVVGLAGFVAAGLSSTDVLPGDKVFLMHAMALVKSAAIAPALVLVLWRLGHAIEPRVAIGYLAGSAIAVAAIVFVWHIVWVLLASIVFAISLVIIVLAARADGALHPLLWQVIEPRVERQRKRKERREQLLGARQAAPRRPARRGREAMRRSSGTR